MKKTPHCVYCGVAVDRQSREHVPTKRLLEEPLPPDMRVIPACAECNSGWSDDEEYLVNFLANITEHVGLQKRIDEGGSVDRALTKLPSKDEKLIAALEVSEGGRVSIKPEINRISRVTTKLAFGLFCLKYGPGKSLSDFSTVWISGYEHSLPVRLRAAQWGMFGGRRKKWKIVQDRVFSYLFAKGSLADDPPSYCFLNFYDTLFAVVSGPHLVGKPKAVRLRSKPW